MKIHSKESPILLPIALLSALTIAINFPIVDLAWPFWDGSIIDISIEEDDLSGIRRWFFELGCPPQYYYYLVLSKAPNPTLTQYIFSLVSLVALANAIYLLCIRTIGTTVSLAILCAISTITFPAYYVLASSVMGFYILCIALFYLSWLLFIEKSENNSIFGISILGMTFSFFINSLLCLHYANFYIYKLTKKESTSKITSKEVMVITIPILFYLFKTLFLTPSGPIYGAIGYNKIHFDNIGQSLGHLARYAYFVLSIYAAEPLILLILVLLLIYLVVVVARSKHSTTRSKLASIGPLLAGASMAILPYAIVQKHPSFGWSSRHALLFGPATALGYSYFFTFAKRTPNHIVKSTIVAAMLAIIISQFYQLSLGFEALYARRKVDNWIVKEATLVNELYSEQCYIGWRFSKNLRNKFGDFAHRFYELNGLVTIATGAQKHINTTLGGDNGDRETIVDQINKEYKMISGIQEWKKSYLIGESSLLSNNPGCVFRIDIGEHKDDSSKYSIVVSRL